MTRVLAIDPGPTESAYVVIDGDRRPLFCGKVPNGELREMLLHRVVLTDWGFPFVAVEMVASYGMPVGADVFDTCVWIGRFAETVARTQVQPARLVYRRDIKLHHCHSARAKDSNVTQALVDRFAPGEPNRGKGTKAEPGFFYGFRADIWQAYALAVYVADTTDPLTDHDRSTR